MEAAVSDFVVWEPGLVTICVLCNGERGGDDPPGPWVRHRPSCRRRIPIYGQFRSVVGYLEYVLP